MNLNINPVAEESAMPVAKPDLTDDADRKRLEIRRNFLMQSARYMQLDIDTTGIINRFESTRYKH